MRKLYFVLLLCFLFCFLKQNWANNIQIQQSQLTGQNITSGADHPNNYVYIKFNITWENSWRNDLPGAGNAEPNNNDAAWVFVKYKTASGIWHHVYLNMSGCVSESNATVSVPADKTGAFIMRSGNGVGTFASQNIMLKWNYVLDGMNDNQISNLQIKVYAIEMVYVNQNSFSIGSGGYESSPFYMKPNDNTSYVVNNEAAINVGSAAGNLYYTSNIDGTPNSDAGDRGTPIPVGFPKGFNAFYCMKHEITQEMYVEFLNSLTRQQQVARVETNIAGLFPESYRRFVLSRSPSVNFRNGISCPEQFISASEPIVFGCDLNGNGIFNEALDGQNIACNYLSWADGISYSDWAGLRPMTELEFEKAGRGSKTPVPYEYAWGTTNVAPLQDIQNNGNTNEVASNGNANCVYADGALFNGPVRVGCFAGISTTREQSGAGYYGILDLTGNLWERTVTIGHPIGRNFQGTHGDGSLSIDGFSTNSDWPDRWANGAGARGSDWALGLPFGGRISDRFHAALPCATRNGNYGFRAVRTAP